MRIRTEVLLGVSILVLLQVLTAFGAIGLLSRMSPAVERILEENVFSNQAADEILAMLALSESDPLPASPERFQDALQRLRRNVTEAAEIPVIETIRESWNRAAAGDREARKVAVDSLLKLVAINQDAMRVADEEAKRLGSAGAWAAVFLALAGFAVSVLVVLRLRQRVLAPLEDLSSTLEAARHGNHHRRCHHWRAPAEVRTALSEVNKLLDRQQAQRVAAAGSGSSQERAVALFLMDQQEAPAFVVGPGGEIVLANRSGLDQLGQDTGELRQRLHQIPESQSHFKPNQVRQIGQLDLWWVGK